MCGWLFKCPLQACTYHWPVSNMPNSSCIGRPVVCQDFTPWANVDWPVKYVLHYVSIWHYEVIAIFILRCSNKITYQWPSPNLSSVELSMNQIILSRLLKWKLTISSLRTTGSPSKRLNQRLSKPVTFPTKKTSTTGSSERACIGP